MAPTLEGRRLRCHHCHWFGHWGRREGVLRGCAEGIGDLWAQGADALCLPFHLWHCKANRKWFQTETWDNPEIWKHDTSWHFTFSLLFMEGKGSINCLAAKAASKNLVTTISLAFQMGRYKMSTVQVLQYIFFPCNPQTSLFPLITLSGNWSSRVQLAGSFWEMPVTCLPSNQCPRL